MGWMVSEDMFDALCVTGADGSSPELMESIRECSFPNWSSVEVEGWQGAIERIEDRAPAFAAVDMASLDRVEGRSAESFADVCSEVPVLVIGDDATSKLDRFALECGAVGACPRSALDAELLERIVEREVTRSERETKHNRMRQALESTHGGVIICDARLEDLPIVYCNNQFLGLTGYDESEVLGRNCRFLQCEETSEENVEAIRRALREERPIRVEILNARRDGERFWNELSIAPIRDEEGEVAGFVGHQRDITRRVEAERYLKRYRVAVENATDIIVIVDREGRYQLVNQRTVELLGRSRDELIGAKAKEFLEPETARQFRQHADAAVEEDGAVRRMVEVELSGDVRTLEVTRAPVHVSGELQATVGVARDVTERRRLEEKISEQAKYDDVTGLLNRRGFHHQSEPAVVRALERGESMSLALIDLEDYEAVNRSFGRKKGDRLLREIADRMESALDDDVTLARLGGDEFALLLDEWSDQEAFASLFRRLDDALESPFEIESTRVHVSFSLGISSVETSSVPEERAGALVRRLLRAAQRAAGEAKAVRGNAWRVSSPNEEQDYDARIQFENRIRRGLEAGEFVPHFQPIFEIADGDLWAFELLVRWNHPDQGFISPGDFIPVAERSGLLHELTTLLVRKTGDLFRTCEIPNHLGHPVQVNLNLSPSQVARRDLAQTLRSVVDDHLPASAELSLEITEGQLLDRLDRVEALRERDFRIIVDDFGTGYSSLTRIKTLPMDELKLDMEFVHGAVENARDRAVLETVAELGRQLGVPVTGEGVETEQQLELLRASGCRAAQGYMLGRPAPMDEMIANIGPDPTA